MRILVVSNLYPPVVFGGYEILCSQVVEALRGRGHEIRVLASSFGREGVGVESDVQRSLQLTTDFPKPGETVGRVDFRLRAIQRVAKVNRDLTGQALRDFCPDIVFCWCLNRMSLGSVFAAQNQGTPVCYTVNDEHPKQFGYTKRVRNARALARYLAERLVWPMATFAGLAPFPITVISHSLKQRLLAANVPFERAEVIHQGISLTAFPFSSMARGVGGQCNLLYAGQLSRVKGVHTILRALGESRRDGKSGFHLTIAGGGVPDYEAELRSIAEEEAIGDKISFLGKIPHDRMAELYGKHHVFIFSSEWEEPFGLTHLEAMASGCAVISTTTGGTNELVRDGENALAYEAGNHRDLASKIAHLMTGEAFRLELAQRARRWVEEYHSFDGYVNRLEDFVTSAKESVGTVRLGGNFGE